MASKIETSIWLAIRARIETLSLRYELAWPGEVFEVPHTGTELDAYLRIGRVSTAPVRMFIPDGKPHERTGSIIITLVYPIKPKITASLYDQVAGTIAEHFKDGTNMHYGGVCVSVTSYPYVQEGYLEDGYWTVPVSIPWRCFA